MPSAHAPMRLLALCAVAVASCALPATATAKKSASPKLPGTFQKRYHVTSATADPDRDGLTNYTEYRAHTSPKKADSDRDGVEDGSEDRDKDKLDAATEQRAGTDPGKKDTDRDGRADAREDADHDGLSNLAEQQTANDPGDPDSDDDDVKDGGENAGQVVSLTGDELVIRLASTGKTVTGGIDAETQVACNAVADDAGSAFSDDDAEPGDDDGAADEGDAGDDGGAADEGDDEGGDAEASAAAFVRATADEDEPGDDDGAADEGDDDEGDATGDPCLDDALAPGAWVHEASLTTGDDGARVFDALTLVADAS